MKTTITNNYAVRQLQNAGVLSARGLKQSAEFVQQPRYVRYVAVYMSHVFIYSKNIIELVNQMIRS